MRMVKVSAVPVINVRCCRCGQAHRSDGVGVFADADGEPFVSYYCAPCKSERVWEVIAEIASAFARHR